MELSRRLQHLRGVLQRHHDDPIGIRYDDVPGMDADAAAGDGDVDLSRSLLVGAAGGGSRGVHRQIHLPQGVHIPDRAVDHQPAQLLLILGIGEHDLPHEGAGGILVIGQHDDVSRLGHIQGLMEKQVVPCPRLDGQGRARHDPLKAAHQPDPGIHGAGAAHGIRDIGRRETDESLQQLLTWHGALQKHTISDGHFSCLLSAPECCC